MSDKKVWRPFEEARVFARSLQLKGWVERYQYRKSGERPNDIPANPEKIHKNDGWISWGDWLGNEERKGWKLSEETRRKISKARKARRNQKNL